MTVYPTVEAADMMYAVRRAEQAEPEATEPVPGMADLGLPWQIREIEFRLSLMESNLKAAKKVCQEGAPEDAILSEAYIRGYLEQTLTQIRLDVDCIRHATKTIAFLTR